MADDDKDSKTEEASGKRISDAVEKGNVPVSREAAMLGSLLGMLFASWMFLPDFAKRLQALLERFIDDPGDFRLESNGDAVSLLSAVMTETMLCMLPIILTLGVIGLLSSLLQNPPQIAISRIAPKGSHISISKGWTRIFGMKGFVEFGKSLFKLIAVSVLAWFLIGNTQTDVVNSLYSEPVVLPQIVLTTLLHMMSALAAGLVVLVGVDIAWTRYSWHRDLRMTKQEVKDEHKQMEGDPIVKGRIKSMQRDRARRRMMEQVPRATLVIANPTHFAVALRYVKSESSAPMVVAKGQDLIALKIREIAEQNGIPVVEDKALARSLYKAVEVDRMIPQEFFKAVAELIIYLTARGRIARPASQGN
jgi:flagellar biosynthesis protein FlhB